MDKPCIYEIRVEGHLTDHWLDWFDGLAIRADPGGETVLSGPLPDQAALFGVLAKLHGLNLALILVKRVDIPQHVLAQQ
jgi:hypothetical protein